MRWVWAGVLGSVAIAAWLLTRPADVHPPKPDDMTRLDPLVADAVRQQIDALNRSRGSAAQWANLARVYHANGLYDLAIPCYRKSVAASPAEPVVWYHLAAAHGQLGDLHAAIDAVQQTVELDPDYGPAWRNFGEWQLELARADRAADAFTRSMELDPNDVTAVIGLVRCRIEQGRPEDAIAMIASHELVESANQAYAYQLLAAARQQMGDHEGASAARQMAGPVAAVSGDPWLASLLEYRTGRDFLLRRGESLAMAERHREAIEIYDELIGAGIRDADVHNMLALSRRALGDVRGSVAAHQAALEIDQHHGPSLFNLAWTHFYHGRTQPAQLTEALALVDRAVASGTQTHDAYALRATLLEHLGRPDEAVEAYRKAYERQPERIESLLRAGMIELERRRWAAAQANFERLLDDHPRHGDAQIGLSLALMEQGRLEDAEHVLTAVDEANVSLARPDAVRARLDALRDKAIGPRSPQ